MTRKKKAQKNLAILQKSILDADGEANSFLSRNQTQQLEPELETKFQPEPDSEPDSDFETDFKDKTGEEIEDIVGKRESNESSTI